MSAEGQSAPLWQLLQGTSAIVQAVQAGRSLTAQLDVLPASIRSGAQALSFQVLRQLGRARALRTLLAPRKPSPPVEALLCSALALSWDDQHAPYPSHTLVSQTVEAARRQRQTQAQAGFINACLRRFLRERPMLVHRIQEDEQARWNHPLWWIGQLQHDHPEHWSVLLERAQQAAPMTLRVNLQRTSVQKYQQRLLSAGIPPGQPVGLCGLQLQKPLPVQQLPGFMEGEVSVQDAAAQLAAPLLLAGLPGHRPMRILDACAAPGGKTGHLLEMRPDAQVLALEIDAGRCERIHQNLDRLSLRAEVRQADAGQPEVWWDGQLFDAILLDAPCSASGIGRRHPDVRWLRRPHDPGRLAAIQGTLLDRLWPLLAPAGQLLYCTCSVFKAEGQEVIQAFLQRNTQARLKPSPGHLLPGSWPSGGSLGDNGLGEHDWFYYALLEKHATAV